MSRPDPFLNLLKDIGYLPLRLPRADVMPLQLLELNGKNLRLLGDLKDTMNAGPAKLPAIKADVATAGEIQGARSSSVKLSIGLDLLGNLLAAIAGSKLDLSAAFKGASTLTFEIGEVTVSCVSIILLDKYLNLATIDPAAKEIKAQMEAGDAGVITAVARAKKYIVSAQNQRGVNVKVDVPIIKQIAGGNVGVTTAGSKKEKIVFQGKDPVTFGVQAARLRYDGEGKITSLKEVPVGSGAVLGLRARGPAAKTAGSKPVLNLVSATAAFVQID